MTMKRAFEVFLSHLDIAHSDKFTCMASPHFGALFFEFARDNGYDIANDPKRVLDRLHIDIGEVVDVGVHDGTPWLYARYPEANFVLVEPQRDAEARLRHRPKSYKLINKAVGETPGTLVLADQAERSSLLSRADGSGRAALGCPRYEVQLVTLDHVIEEHCCSESIALKVDVEGFEYPTLKGLNSEARRVQLIILELSVRNRFVGERHFGEIVALLMEKGFRFYNIMNTARPPPPNAYDVVFLPESSDYFDV